MDNFPKTEIELKRFIDQASKTEGSPEKLQAIDRTVLQGGLDYNRLILDLIIRQETAYWTGIHKPILESKFPEWGEITFRGGSEKYAYCYRPHGICRGYDRHDRHEPGSIKAQMPESQLDRQSEYDLEYLWAGIGRISFTFNVPEDRLE